jgi:hypothetical protein
LRCFGSAAATVVRGRTNFLAGATVWSLGEMAWSGGKRRDGDTRNGGKVEIVEGNQPCVTDSPVPRPFRLHPAVVEAPRRPGFGMRSVCHLGSIWRKLDS